MKEAPVNPIILCRDPSTRIIEKQANPVGIEKQANPVERTRPCTDRPTTRASASGAPHEPPRVNKGKNRALDEVHTSQSSQGTVMQSNSQNNRYFSPTVEDDSNRITEVDDIMEDEDIHIERGLTLPVQDHEALKAPQRQTKTAQSDPPVVPGASAASSGPKESVPIKLISESSIQRFNIAGFLCDTDITLKFGQLLDRSLQIRAQLARYLQAKVPSRRGRRRQPQVMAVSARGPLPKIIDEGFDDIPDTQCFYIEAYVDGIQFNRCMVDGGAVIELIPPHMVAKLGLKPKPMEEGWYVKVADNRRVPIKEYVILEVIVQGIRTYLRAFLIDGPDSYDLLLSRNWMARVGALEDHLGGTLKIQGKSGVVVNVPASEAPTPEVEVMHQKDHARFEDLEAYESGSELSFVDDDAEPELLDQLLEEAESIDMIEYQQTHAEQSGKALRQ
jgi:hypothetical protein